jgi:hypothetical protein
MPNEKHMKELYGKSILQDILRKNQDKKFVKRIINRSPMKLDNKDGTHSTHSMAYSEAEGKFYVYPTVIETEGELKRLKSEEAWKHAKDKKEFIRFDSKDEADWFSKNYKNVWD